MRVTPLLGVLGGPWGSLTPLGPFRGVFSGFFPGGLVTPSGEPKIAEGRFRDLGALYRQGIPRCH